MKVFKVFVSFCFDTEEEAEDKDSLSPEQFIHRISYYLSKQTNLELCCWNQGRKRKNWDEVIANQLDTCDKLVYFIGKKKGDTQDTEKKIWKEKRANDYPEHTVLVHLPQSPSPWQDDMFPLIKHHVYVHDKLTEESVLQCAFEVFLELKNIDTTKPKAIKESGWIEPDGLPLGYPFAYEKAIIEEFAQGHGRLITPKRLQQGCPINWPEVSTIQQIIKDYYPPHKDMNPPYFNPIPESTIGRYRDDKERIIVDVRSQYHKRGVKNEEDCCLIKLDDTMDNTLTLTLHEAGPREKLCYPLWADLNVGIVVSGGIAPGINAVIAGICQRHRTYTQKKEGYQLTIKLYRDGFSGMLREDWDKSSYILKDQDISDWANQAGAVNSTSRHDALLDSHNRAKREDKLTRLIGRLKGDNIDILYVIGGEGSMRAAHALSNRANLRYRSDIDEEKIDKPISIVAIPKTMDNDVLWVWQTFGFLSAVEKAKELIVDLSTEAKANPRLCIMQLFGSDSGFVVSHAALASGACKAALIPEVDFDLAYLSEYIRDRLVEEYKNREKHDNQSPYGIILLSEVAIPRDVEDYIDQDDYPDLHLDADEKKAIRDFIGSSLLYHEDIKNEHWGQFCVDLKNIIRPITKKRMSNKLSKLNDKVKEIYKIIECYAGDKKDPVREVQELIVTTLNNLIQEENALSHFITNSKEKSLDIKIRHLQNYLKEVKGWSRKKTLTFGKKDPKLTCHQLSTYALSAKAKAALNALEELLLPDRIKGDPQEIWLTHFNAHCRDLYQELIKLYNRLYLKWLFPEHIEPLDISGDRRVYGQTPDKLRSGGLKIVASVLEHDIRTKIIPVREFWRSFRVFVNEPRHLIRAIPPSVSDVIFGQRLGMLAVDNAMAGYTDFMVSQWLTEYVLVPLELVVLGRKRVPQEGIFWKSVLNVTGQPPQMKWGSKKTGDN